MGVSRICGMVVWQFMFDDCRDVEMMSVQCVLS
jgi:hypothetical protein